MDDELELACLKEESEELVEGFKRGSEASFEQSLKRWCFRGQHGDGEEQDQGQAVPIITPKSSNMVWDQTSNLSTYI